MNATHEPVLNPLAAVGESAAAPRRGARQPGERRVIGLLDNSKPNVSDFLDAIAETLRASADVELVTVRKPRSAGPTADIRALAERCDFVVNAVAD